MAGYDLGSILTSIEEQSKTAQAENLKRYEQAMAIYDEIVGRYKPGGEFEAKSLAELERRKGREVGGEEQKLISGGLAGTTVFGGVGRRWEEEVGAPARLTLEDILMQRLSQAQTGKAEFIERREDVYPDYSMIAQLAAQAGQAGQGGAGGEGGAVSPYYGTTDGGGGGGETEEWMSPFEEWNPTTYGQRMAPGGDYGKAAGEIVPGGVSEKETTTPGRTWYQYAPGEYKEGMPYVAGGGGYWKKGGTSTLTAAAKAAQKWVKEPTSYGGL